MSEDIQDEYYELPESDPIAERIYAYIALLNSVNKIKDTKLRGVGIEMLQTIKNNIPSVPRGELTAIQGGKNTGAAGLKS